jgi:predicted TIM-barrel enzyme
MKDEIGDAPLAIASGVDIDNISSYAGSVDESLVSTSVETSKGSGRFDREKLKALIAKAHELG